MSRNYNPTTITQASAFRSCVLLQLMYTVTYELLNCNNSYSEDLTCLPADPRGSVVVRNPLSEKHWDLIHVPSVSVWPSCSSERGGVSSWTTTKNSRVAGERLQDTLWIVRRANVQEKRRSTELERSITNFLLKGRRNGTTKYAKAPETAGLILQEPFLFARVLPGMVRILF